LELNVFVHNLIITYLKLEVIYLKSELHDGCAL